MTIYRTYDERFTGLIDETQGFSTLGKGFRFTEGATWHPGGRHVTFSDIPSSRIHRWSAASGEIETLRDPSDMTNGMTYDREGRLLMCEHATSRVTRLEPDGSMTVLADRWQGQELNSPNDIVVNRDGRIWFTDPLYGREAQTGVAREPGLPFRGLFSLDPRGRLELVADDYDGPNGLCLSPDQTKLYVNDSERLHIRVYDLDADGSATGGELFAETRDTDGTLGEGSPDGMKVDALGNVWCTGQGGIHVFAPDGTLLGVLLTPRATANFCFGADDLRRLFVCAVTHLYSLRLRQPGHPIYKCGYKGS